MYNDVIKLISESNTVNEYGDTVSVETERTVFAGVRSITQNEFYQAQATGLRPEIKFILSDFLEYQNEQVVEYAQFNQDPQRYTVLRTYRNNNELELVCRRGIDQ